MFEPSRVEREAASPKPPWEAALSLHYTAGPHRTLVTRRHRGPLLVQRPFYEDGPVCESVVIHPPGGMVGGDRLEVSVALEPGSHALLTTPGAAKWYRSARREACQHLALRARDAILEWLPQETIVFDGAHARMDMEVELSGSASFCGWEVLCLGRTASGERFRQGRIRRRTTLRRDGRLLWSERAVIVAEEPRMASAVGLRGRTVSATLLFAPARVDAEAADLCRRLQPEEPAAAAGLSIFPELLVAHYLGNSSEGARRHLAALWRVLRPAHLGRQAVAPRLWNT